MKPETSTTYELGFRTKSRLFQGVIAGYYVDFKDRIIAFANGSGIQGNPAILSNVGDVRTWGVEAADAARHPELSLFGLPTPIMNPNIGTTFATPRASSWSRPRARRWSIRPSISRRARSPGTMTI